MEGGEFMSVLSGWITIDDLLRIWDAVRPDVLSIVFVSMVLIAAVIASGLD